MFEIPEDLPLSVAPLAWLLGRWQGWGMLATPGDEEDRVVLQDVVAEIIGDHVRMVTTIYHAHADGGVDPLWDAVQGLDAITADELLREETSYWRVLPAPDFSFSFGDEEAEVSRDLVVTGSDTDGLAYLWVGMAMGPRIRLVSDVVAREEDAPDVGSLGRMYGLVSGELFWTSENTIGDADPVVQYSGRLQRVEK